MNNKKHPLLAREGWPHILIVGGLALIVQFYFGTVVAIPFWIALVFVLNFFRDPVRSMGSTAKDVVCPADGKIVATSEVDDPYLKRRAVRISVFMNVFDVHSNRAPVTGEVKQVWYHKGKFLNAVLDKASEANERNALWIRTEDGKDVVVVQVAGLIARRILCYAHPNDRLERGERYGFIRFGSRVDIYLPLGARPRVALGDKVKGGAQLIAEFPG